MPSTVESLLRAVQLSWAGAARWHQRVQLDGPGVYLVALAEAPNEIVTQPVCPVSAAAVQQLLDVRPELLLDGRRPDTVTLADRLASMWLADETVLYIGLAGTSVAKRVRQYYKTPLGARKPHAGGWPLKTLANLDQLWVHYARCASVDAAERAMLDTFASGVSASARAALCDPDVPLPFANLTVPRGARKRHGISGAREPYSHRSVAIVTGGVAPPSGERRQRLPVPVVPASDLWTQPITCADLKAGRIRIPVGTKPQFPPTRQVLRVILRGRPIDVRWDPRDGHDRSRSGVLSVGRSALDGLAAEGERLTVTVRQDGDFELS